MKVALGLVALYTLPSASGYRPHVARHAPRAAHVRLCTARAGPTALVEPVSALQSFGAALEHSLNENGLEVDALATGITFLIGDGIAQWMDMRREDADGAPEVEATATTQVAEGLPSTLPAPGLKMCWRRLVRSFVAGSVVLGPLTHFYYAWVASQDLRVHQQVLLDNTIFLFLDNAAFVASLAILGGGSSSMAAAAASAADAAADGWDLVSEALADTMSELWSMQLTGWRILPVVAVLNYLFVPNNQRVLFMDLADIVMAALLSMQHSAHTLDPHVVEGNVLVDAVDDIACAGDVLRAATDGAVGHDPQMHGIPDQHRNAASAPGRGGSSPRRAAISTPSSAMGTCNARIQPLE
mmetsp:Transcript_24138/g.65345  ORF Transcript_24138/g.65345 Transcript_24138/m.65345 type:complete len:355 (+) Transcript_24138:88-1152(+)